MISAGWHYTCVVIWGDCGTVSFVCMRWKAGWVKLKFRLLLLNIKKMLPSIFQKFDSCAAPLTTCFTASLSFQQLFASLSFFALSSLRPSSVVQDNSHFSSHKLIDSFWWLVSSPRKIRSVRRSRCTYVSRLVGPVGICARVSAVRSWTCKVFSLFVLSCQCWLKSKL